MPWGVSAAAGTGLSAGTGAAIGGGLLGLGNVLSGVITGGAQRSAADKLASAYTDANTLQKQIYGDTSANLQPYITAGTTALSQLGTGTASPSSPLLQTAQSVYGQAPTLGTLPTYNPTAADYTSSPGYSWELSEGIDKLQNAGVAGLGSVSGNTLKSLDKYTVGAAGQDYYNWLQYVYGPEYKSKVYNVTAPYDAAVQGYNTNVANYNTGQANQFNRLSTLAGYGSTAATNLGQFGSNYASAYGRNLTGGAAASGSGNLASTQSILGGVNTAATNLSGSGFLSNLFGGGDSSSAGTTGYAASDPYGYGSSYFPYSGLSGSAGYYNAPTY